MIPELHYVRANIDLPASPAGDDEIMNASYDREIGRLGALVEALQEALKKQHEENKQLHNDVMEIKALINEMKGGSKVIFWVGGLVSGSVGALLVKFFPLFLR